nr:interferon-induced 35 kDa protein-like [Zootoca vivipara]
MGGEVVSVERLRDSGHVVLTFMDDGVAERLIEIGQYQVPIGEEIHTVKLSHCLGGEIAELQVRGNEGYVAMCIASECGKLGQGLQDPKRRWWRSSCGFSILPEAAIAQPHFNKASGG